MTNLQISIITFILAIGTIALLYVILMVTQKAPVVWRRGLFVCMGSLCVGVIFIFIPELARYAAMIGMGGVFYMIAAVCRVRWQEAKGKDLVGVDTKGYAVRAAIFVVVGGLLAAPFFAVFNNQTQIKKNQYGVFNLVQRLSSQLDQMICLLERDHDERIAQAHRDSLSRAEIFRSLGEVSGKVDKSLKNDGEVKAKLEKSQKPRPGRPLTIYVPAPAQFRYTAPLPSINREVNPVPTKLPNKRKYGYVDTTNQWLERIFSGPVGRLDSLPAPTASYRVKPE